MKYCVLADSLPHITDYILFLNIRKTAANRLPHIQLMRMKRQQCLTTAIHHNTLFAKAAVNHQLRNRIIIYINQTVHKRIRTREVVQII